MGKEVASAKNIQKGTRVLFFAACFIFCFVFFSEIHPLVIFDTDDWCYISQHRVALPQINAWNPTRVFPEVLMPAIAGFAHWAIEPFVGSFVTAQIIAHAVIASVFITFYLALLEIMLEKTFSLSRFSAICLTVLFFAFHFLALRIWQIGNGYFFWSVDVTAFYYYVLSNLLCASIVLYAARTGIISNFFNNKDLKRKSIFVAGLYFALFSNLFASIIVASFATVSVIEDLLKERKQKHLNLYVLVKRNGLSILIIITWLVIQVMEANGGRSESLSSDFNFLDQLKAGITLLADIEFNRTFSLIVLGSYLLFFCLLIKEKGAHSLASKSIVACLICGIISLFYVILICTKAGLGYLTRPDVLFGSFFFICVGSIISLTEAFRKYKKLVLILPLVVLMVVNQINTTGQTFKNTNSWGVSNEIAISVTEDIIGQIKTESSKGAETMQLRIPKSDTEDNWPLAIYGGFYYSNSLLEFGIIDKEINIEIIPDSKKNIELGLSADR